MNAQSCPSRGTWIEIKEKCKDWLKYLSRAPRGARGLKWVGLGRKPQRAGRSCPSRGTWIEIAAQQKRKAAPQRRAPRGARGLKFFCPAPARVGRGSCPSRGTWIEISFVSISSNVYWSCPSRGTWIEITSSLGIILGTLSSCPSRGTWIEICLT